MGLGRQRSLGIKVRGGQAVFAEVECLFGHIRLKRSGSFQVSQEEEVKNDTPPSPEPATDRGDIQVLKPASCRRVGVIVGLPRSECVFRFLHLPNVDDAGLPGLVSWELERHIPFPPEETCYSFQKLQQKGNMAEVLLVAARRVDVERAIEEVEQLGLTPTAVDVSSIAGTNALLYHNKNSREDSLIVIEINDREASVNVVNEGNLVSSRTVPFADDSINPLLAELKRVMDSMPKSPWKVFVCGGSDDLCLRLKQALDLPAELWGPVPSSVDALTFGLALKGLVKLPIQIDLLPPERRVKKRERVLVTMWALLSLVGLLGLGWGISAASLERRTLKQLDQHLAKVEQEAAVVELLKEDFAALKSRLLDLEELVSFHDRPLLVMKELFRLLPTDVDLQELQIREDQLKIRGSTGTSASGLISVFERSILFENAAFTSPISSREKGREVFQIEVSIKTRHGSIESPERPGDSG